MALGGQFLGRVKVHTAFCRQLSRFAAFDLHLLLLIDRGFLGLFALVVDGDLFLDFFKLLAPG
jgi:hypothetical protein